MCNSIYTAKVIILLLFYFLHTLLPYTTYKSNVCVSWINSFFSHDSDLTSIVHLYVHTSSKPKLIYCQLSLSIEFLHELTSLSIDFHFILTFKTFCLVLTIRGFWPQIDVLICWMQRYPRCSFCYSSQTKFRMVQKKYT